jgi:hypothetical protein
MKTKEMRKMYESRIDESNVIAMIHLFYKQKNKITYCCSIHI